MPGEWKDLNELEKTQHKFLLYVGDIGDIVTINKTEWTYISIGNCWPKHGNDKVCPVCNKAGGVPWGGVYQCHCGAIITNRGQAFKPLGGGHESTF